MYAVWFPDQDEKIEDATEYAAIGVAAAAKLHVSNRVGEYGWEHFPVIAHVRVSTTGEEFVVEVNRELVPEYVPGEPKPVKMEPAVHVLWGGDAVCYDVRLAKVPSSWPKGQTWIGIPELRATPERMAQVSCARCAKRAKSIIAGLEQIGAPSGR